MTAVFLMQPLGQICAYVVGLVVLHGLNNSHGYFDLKRPYDPDNNSYHARMGIDVLWRVVAGVGGVPALVALLFRWTIPESGRYTCDIKRDSWKAFVDTVDGTTGWLSRSQSSSGQQGGKGFELEDVEAGPTNSLEDMDINAAGYPDRRDFGDLQTHGHQSVYDSTNRTIASTASGSREETSGLPRVQEDLAKPHSASTGNQLSTTANPPPAHVVDLQNPATIETSRRPESDRVPGLDDEEFTWTQWSKFEWQVSSCIQLLLLLKTSG